MVKLCCAVVGEDRVLIVEIDDEQLVGDLKKEIKREAGYEFPADKLDLYLAKQYANRSSPWLTTAPRHADYSPLLRGDEGAKATYLKEGVLLDSTWSIEDHFSGAPKKNVIHVLVKIPDDRSIMINVPVGGYPLLNAEAARTTKDCEHASSVSFVVSSSSWALSYLSQVLSKIVSESKKKL